MVTQMVTPGNNRMHVCIEYANQMKIVSPLERKQGFPTPFSGNGRKDGVLESSEVDDTLNLDSTITKKTIITLSCLLAMEALIWKCI